MSVPTFVHACILRLSFATLRLCVRPSLIGVIPMRYWQRLWAALTRRDVRPVADVGTGDDSLTQLRAQIAAVQLDLADRDRQMAEMRAEHATLQAAGAGGRRRGPGPTGKAVRQDTVRPLEAAPAAAGRGGPVRLAAGRVGTEHAAGDHAGRDGQSLYPVDRRDGKGVRRVRPHVATTTSRNRSRMWADWRT
jgi:hypothetical protein